jgi:hypothetical protein
VFVFKIADVKTFMGKLLREDVFAPWEVRTVELSALARFEINGALDRDFLDADPQGRAFCLWRELQPYIFGLIKGGKRPKMLKVVLSLPPAQVAELHKNAAAYFLNILFERDEILCTAASSERNFAMDKGVDRVWEEYIRDFFRQKGIEVAEVE